ncbi:MAG: thymidylate synthase, partial [Bifidobacteriaceae bacterium]|nr:thymidylate synthase [Bifidobacteriaceae bacterium]
MADMRFTNVNTAVRGLLAELMGPAARQVAARGFQTRELGPIQFTLANPQQRCLILPERRNNIFASIAETIWVVSGRNDLAFLQHYLPRATDFSDDGTTWRAAYGPRLRNWAGVDQLAEVCRLLLGDADSRRAVMAIFDPARDYVASKDIPCNNWLHWLIRDGRLNCHVAIRSNDIIWGFSGINAFEWSVLQEILAYWVGVSIGEITYSVSSEHLYSHHYERAQQILAATSSDHDVYTATNLTRFAFATKWKDFSEVLDQWFAVEQTIRQNGEWQAAVDQFPDPLLQAFLRMLAVYWSAKREEPLEQTL